MTAARQDLFLDTDLVAFAPCGCWFAVMLEARDLAENARRVAEFVKEAKQSGSEDVRRVTHAEWVKLSADEHGKPLPMCQHEPRWGGMKATHEDCPQCWKACRIRKDGTLAAHQYYGRTCSQESREVVR